MPAERILVVEDDLEVLKLMRALLQGERYQVTTVRDIFQARAELRKAVPQLIVLDVQLPDDSGVNLCRELRETPQMMAVPVLFVTGNKRSVADKVLALKMGGDDYLLKPFDTAEFLARVEALLRRSRMVEGPMIRLESGAVVVDVTAHQAYLKGKPLKLWPKEFLLLKTFLSSKNRLLTRQHLYETVWGSPFEGSTRQVDFLVHRLRQKLGPIGERIASVKGLGYRFDGE